MENSNFVAIEKLNLNYAVHLKKELNFYSIHPNVHKLDLILLPNKQSFAYSNCISFRNIANEMTVPTAP